MLEDESQRIALTGDIPTSTSVTGVSLLLFHVLMVVVVIAVVAGAVIAVIGHELSSGKFEVEGYTYCGIPSPSQETRSLDSSLEQGEDRLNDALAISLISQCNILIEGTSCWFLVSTLAIQDEIL